MAGLILASFTGFLSTAAFGQGTAPVNPKFIEWQKRRADEVARKSQESETGANAQKRAAPKQAAAPADEDEDLGMGLLPTLVDMDYLADLNSGVVRAPVGGFPSSYDLRSQGRLTGIRNQNPYGTCWAHATMASLESWILGSEEEENDFSENNLANLHGWDWGFDDGGNATIATAYLVRWGGPVDETTDPYPDWGGSTAKSPVRHVQRVFWIPGKSASLDNDAIKQAVMERGAVYVSYYHASSYYKSATASYYYPESGNGNHAVAIVGWNDNYSASNFTTKPAGNGAYLVRNSWGTGWGSGGYFWVSYYDGVFARSTMYSFANAEPTDNYGKIYQYDPLGDVSHFSTPYCANMFTATGTDKIAAIGFYALAPKTAYSLSIYTGCQSGKPTSGTCAISQSGTIDEAGFVTLPLSKSVAVASGSRFSVVLNLSTPGYGYPSAFEYAYTGITSGANASAGQSFYSFNGTSWTDLTSWNGTAHFCIKAYTESASVVVSLASVAVSGPASVESGKTGKYICTAKYSDNSGKPVSAAWSVVSGSEHAAISGDGTLTAGKTSLDRTVVIRASYAEGGVAKSDDWQLTVTAGPPAAPADLSATSGTETRAVRLTWAAVTGAESYSVYRSVTSSPGNALYLGISESGKYSDSDAVPGVDYWYFVKAKNSSGASDFSAGASGWRALAAPANVSAGDGASVDSVRVTWDAVEGAAYYRVLRAESFDGAATPLTGWISATEFADSTAEPGAVYWYSVEAAVDSTGNRPSAAGIPDDGFRAVPVVPSAIAIEGDGAIPSGGTASYAAFAVYSDGSRGESPLSPAWEVSAGTVSRTGGVTVPTVSANADIVISAQTSLEGVAISGTKAVTVTATAPGAPSNLRLVSATAGCGISLAWDAVPGASRYVVSRGASGGTTDFTTAEATFTDMSATPGVAYSYRVAAENAAGTGPQSAPVTVTIPLAAPTGVKATSDRTDGVRVTWGATSGATHYRVARAVSATGAKTELGTWTADTAYLDTPPAADTVYWYFVKAATDSFGSNPGAWSAGVEGRMKAVRTLLSLSVSGPDRVASGGDAVYSCKASWSDGAEEAVSPAWSVSPASAGSIDGNGRFAAASVSSDVGAIVTAAYGGKTGTASVTVLAPAAATAEITSVTAAQRWPFASLVDIDYTLATTPAGTKATISVSAFDEDHGAAVAATTLSGDGADGPIAAGPHRLTWNLAADHPGFHAADLRIGLSAVPANPVTVTFDGNGGSPSVPSMSGFEGSAYGSLPTATRTGYTLDGWFTAGGDEATAASPFDANVATLYAHWTPNTYTIHFDPNGGTGSMPDMAVPYGTATNLSASAFARTGYIFTGWAASASGAVIHGDRAGVANLASSDGAVVTLYAAWIIAAPTGLAAAQDGKAIVLTWNATDGASQYQVLRWTSATLASATALATVSGTTYTDAAVAWLTEYTYWVAAIRETGSATSDGVSARCVVNLMPLKSLLNSFDGIRRDQVLSDDEMYIALNNPAIGNLDGNKTTISADELDILTRIQALNEDKSLISAVMRGEYDGIADSTMDELVAVSEKVRDVTNGYTFAPGGVAASEGNGGLSARVTLSWTAPNPPDDTVSRYEIYRAATTNGAETLVAMVTTTSWTDTDVSYRQPYWYRVKAVYASQSGAYSLQVKGYWGDWCFPGNGVVNLMPLKSLLNVLDVITVDRAISDDEMTIAFNNPSIGDMDGNPKAISADELDILTRIQALNQNKDLISAVMRGDYTYAGMTYANMVELQAISDKIREI